MQLSRRDFIGAGSLALAGCCAPCAGRTYVSEPVEILRTARLRNRGERLRMAFIGSGGFVISLCMVAFLMASQARIL